MTDKTFFVVPAQGAQYPGMAVDFLRQGGERVKQLFSLASQIQGKDMADLLSKSSPEYLKRTDVSQPAITLANLAAAEYLAEKGITPSACAGFSLGEYAALAAAGVISEEDCLFLVTHRGNAMQAAIDRIQGGDEANAPGMAAVVGLSPENVEALIAEWRSSGLTADLYAANFNSSKQVAVSGSAAALGEAEKRFKEAGARRFMRLAVAGPYHSPFMKEAADAFAPYLEKVHFNDPKIPIFSNVTGKQVLSGAEAKALAVKQIVEPVRWTDEEALMVKFEPKELLETGPGKVLQGLWKDLGNSIPCYSAGTAAEIDELYHGEAKKCG
jgi:[acyl-carrier-protein] S-malonyltransferase